jgi:ribosomal protein L7/L12
MQLDQLDLYDLGQMSLVLQDILTPGQIAQMHRRIPAVMKAAGSEEPESMREGFTAAEEQMISELIRTEKKIHAIKEIRRITGKTLRESKGIADDWFA